MLHVDSMETCMHRRIAKTAEFLNDLLLVFSPLKMLTLDMTLGESAGVAAPEEAVEVPLAVAIEGEIGVGAGGGPVIVIRSVLAAVARASRTSVVPEMRSVAGGFE